MRVMIVDGYNKPSRERFDEVGMRPAWKLFEDLLLRYAPEAEVLPWLSSDEDTPDAFSDEELKQYDAILWPGCNLTIYHDQPEVQRHKNLCKQAFELGIPQFGSCWAVQLACVVAGGVVEANPKGREMGIARNIALTEAGKKHPMYAGKPPVFSAFESHDDHVTQLPEGATVLAGNPWSAVQSVEVRLGKGVMVTTQYHTEYDLNEMARLIEARDEKLIKLGFFRNADDLRGYVAGLDALAKEPSRWDLRWQYSIDDDILDDTTRELEFKNWLHAFVLNGHANQEK